ncbi:MAG TPA: hypothetical protein VHE78_18030 [Gemmatimonadaceae bacterium]|nr:hypothetical protein [Gemmatimonadaceae bacterium]
MSPRLNVFGVGILIFALSSHAQAQVAMTTRSREALRNDVSIELLGNSILYSFSYQRMLSNAFALNAGLSALGQGSSSGSSSIVFIPVGAKLYLMPRNGSIYLGGGGVFVSSKVTSGPFGDGGASTTYGYAGLGFEYRSSGGLLFRGTAYGLFSNGSYFTWPGLSVGYAF